MKKILIKTFLFLSIILGLGSCEDFLEIEPESSATTGNAFRTAEDIEAALVGLYQTFYQEYYVWDEMLLGDVRADNAYAGGDDPAIYEYDLLEVTPLNPRIAFDWRHLYNGIAKANLVISKAPAIDDPGFDEQRREEIIAEAKFIRASHYFELVKLFGAVPLVYEFGQTQPSEVNIPRSSVEEVYNAIIDDLEDALVLPHTYNNISLDNSRITKGAVNALLAKVYAQKPNSDYEKVLEFANAVINSPADYELHPSYVELFDGTSYDNSEAILQIQYIANTPQANWGPQMLLPPSISGDQWRKYATPSIDLVEAYEAEGDTIRANTNIIWDEVDYADEYWKPCAERGSIPFVYKWKHAEGWASGDYTYILRLADILLLKAEALNALGRDAEAIEVLNVVRARVDLPPLDVGTSQEVREQILNERRLELAFEGERWNDLVRYDELQSEMTEELREFILTCGEDSPVEVEYDLENEKGLLPIPQTELNRNPNLEQNSGY